MNFFFLLALDVIFGLLDAEKFSKLYREGVLILLESIEVESMVLAVGEEAVLLEILIFRTLFHFLIIINLISVKSMSILHEKTLLKGRHFL